MIKPRPETIGEQQSFSFESADEIIDYNTLHAYEPPEVWEQAQTPSPNLEVINDSPILTHNHWYRELLDNLDFKVRAIRADRPFADILKDYCQQVAALNSANIAHQALRYELRQVVRHHNKQLASELQQYYPGRHTYQHRRRCPYNNQYYLNLDKDDHQLLIYEDRAAIAIFNSVGLQAIIHNLDKLRQRLEECRQQAGYSKLDLYDVLPTSFLIGRIWAVRRLNSYVEHHRRRHLGRDVGRFEFLNRQVAKTLRSPRTAGVRQQVYNQVSYYAIHGYWTNVLDDERDLWTYGLQFK